MEFFQCPCPERGEVILDNVGQGPNKDVAGNVLPKQCNEGRHTISLKCTGSKKCSPEQVDIEITGTNPILPLEVPFTCTP